MSMQNANYLQQLQADIEQILEAQMGAISEYALIQELQVEPYQWFDAEALRDPLSLFQTHFLVYHCLHRIRQHWRQSEHAELQIIGTTIRALPYQSGTDGIIHDDALARYYLDLSQLDKTHASDVERLLDRFWQQMAGQQITQVAESELQQARELMAVDEHYDMAQLKRQYRVMVHQHHPDKGGDEATMKQLQRAYKILRMQLHGSVTAS
ncbi:molecular chaperone DnaJ [Idiomarina tyrosinivorans]|uniref:Molecular chaperone DnaJ n=1 Tax=Idiomarina tyrosinivorans TaxID=1445662 RepID=A0A432ZM17_9GAMM|nr:DNA-J related domain-containing protein [Idiomarina tyrosinivorans]RUO78872.1 molecular chaperone DnaJ [Idiomarina tyrosinivorans]